MESSESINAFFEDPGKCGEGMLLMMQVFIYIFTLCFFISNPIFRLSLDLLSEAPKMRLKIAMKLLTFFGDYSLK